MPADSSEFTSRHAVLESLRNVVLPQGTPTTPAPLVTIYGRPGTGKSALAVHLAHELHASYPYAQLFVDLEGTNPRPLEPLQPSEALHHLLSQLGVTGPDMPTDLPGLVAAYRAELRGQPAMILLDNAYDEDQVEWLLPDSSTCLVLITSRRRMDRITGSTPYRLGPMTEPESLALLERVAGAHLRSTADEPQTARVAELCGCLPLALRIAGLQLRSCQVAEVVSRLEDRQGRLGALYTGNLDIRTSFGVSYERLSDRERALFRRLRLLVDPVFDLEMAAVLLDCEPGLARDALDRLVKEQLLERDGEGDHRFDDLIGLYADERLNQDEPQVERDAAGGRMLRMYLAEAVSRAALIEPAIVHIDGGQPPPAASLEEQLAALDWFERQRHKLCAAWRLAVDLQVHEVTWKIAASLGPFFDLRGGQPEWTQMQDAAQRAARATGDIRALTWTSLGAGQVSRLAGQLEEAQQQLQDARDKSVVGGWPDLEGRAAHLIGCVEQRRGHLDEALRRYGRAAACFQAEQQLHRWVNTVIHVATALHELEMISSAEIIRLGELARDAVMELPQELWTIRMTGKIAEFLAGVAMKTGDLEDAGVYSIRCDQAYDRIGYRHGRARALRELGRVRTLQQHWGLAEEHLKESKALFEAIGDGAGSANVGSLLEILEKERLRSRGQTTVPAAGPAEERAEGAAGEVPTAPPAERFGVFVSYSQDDTETADRVASELRGLGYAVWYAPWSIEAGESIAGKINEALGLTDTLLALLSPRSVASRWVSFEWESALAAVHAGQNIAVVPILIEQVEVPPILLGIKLIDMTGEKFDEGLTDLKRLLAGRSQARPPGQV